MPVDRLTELEVKLAFQEHTIAQLDEVIQKLQAKMERLDDRLQELAEEHASSLAPLDNPPPPHY